MAWAGSTRSKTLPSDWSSRRRTVIARDRGLCQWPTTTGICGQPFRDVDHRVHRLDHRIESLWCLCGEHHDAKTHAEATAARPRLRRPAEPHPGFR